VPNLVWHLIDGNNDLGRALPL